MATDALNLSVQHCNARTDYVMVKHQFQPDDCGECADIVDLCEGDVVRAQLAIDIDNRYSVKVK